MARQHAEIRPRRGNVNLIDLPEKASFRERRRSKWKVAIRESIFPLATKAVVS